MGIFQKLRGTTSDLFALGANKDELIYVDRSGNDLRFTDKTNTTPVTLSTLVAKITGPASSTLNAIARFADTAGNLIANSSATIDNNGYIDNSQGKYNGTRYYNAGTTDPATPTPADGDRYYNTTLKMWMVYDSSRTKWLSADSVSFTFGRSGSTAAGSYVEGHGNVLFTSTRGYTTLYKATIVGFGVTRDNTASATYQITEAGTTVVSVGPTTALKDKSNTLNTDVGDNSVLGIRNAAGGGTVSNVTGWVRLQWRA
jgi:hypothetical protein